MIERGIDAAAAASQTARPDQSFGALATDDHAL